MDLSVRFHFPRDQCGPPFPPSCLTKAQFFSCLQKQPTNVLMGIKASGSWKKTVWFNCKKTSIGYWDDEQHFAIIKKTSLTYTNVHCSCCLYELISISSTQFITPESQQHTTLQIVHSNKKEKNLDNLDSRTQPYIPSFAMKHRLHPPQISLCW